MKERKLTYRFHDPNPAAVTADYIVKTFLEVNMRKVEMALQEATVPLSPDDEAQDTCREHPA